MIKQEVTTTIGKFVESRGVGALTFHNTRISEDNIDSAMSLFSDLFDENSELILFNEKEKHTYDMNMRAFSHVLYGTTDLWFTIALLNDIRSPIYFTNMSTVRVLTHDGVKILNDLMNKF